MEIRTIVPEGGTEYFPTVIWVHITSRRTHKFTDSRPVYVITNSPWLYRLTLIVSGHSRIIVWNYFLNMESLCKNFNLVYNQEEF